MPDMIKLKIKDSADFAVICFLFAGALYFLYYCFQTGKFGYIILSIVFYLISFVLRKIVFKVENTKGFTEPGIFFITFVFLAYVLLLFGLDNEVKNYLPNAVLTQTGSAFIFVFIGSLLPNDKVNGFKVLLFLGLLDILYVIQLNQALINSFFAANPWLADYIIGFPVLYLGLIVTGLGKFLIKIRKSN